MRTRYSPIFSPYLSEEFNQVPPPKNLSCSYSSKDDRGFPLVGLLKGNAEIPLRQIFPGIRKQMVKLGVKTTGDHDFLNRRQGEIIGHAGNIINHNTLT